MDHFVTVLLSISVVTGLGGEAPTATHLSVHSEPLCHDWGESGNGAVQVLQGEAASLYCPLFSHPTVYNYSSAQAAGLNLVWYHFPAGQDMEQPLDLSQRLSKERERLWLQPATAQDTGQYICMLGNKTSCTKIAMRLEVVPRGSGSVCEITPAKNPQQVTIPLQGGKTLSCPDIEDVRMNHSRISVTWYHGVLKESTGLLNEPEMVKCYAYPFWNSDREVRDDRLVVHNMLKMYAGNYYCVVNYETKGREMNFSRMIKVTAVSTSSLPKEPSILIPAREKIFTVKLGSDVSLPCRAFFPYLEGHSEMWWTIDGKTMEQLRESRFTKTLREVLVEDGDRTEESILQIKDFTSKDLLREYNCSVRNNRGSTTRRAQLKEEAYLPSVELGCGLGVTLFLMLAMFVVYHIFWLELLLLYRSWFGTDERSTDDKEYDIYISYARNSEEEQFVLLTLRRVLENELGYTVCIFDRDSLPGGTITDETLSFISRSRRLLVVLSPGYGTQGTQALLELKVGLDNMAWGGDLRVILLQYKPLARDGWVRELRHARVALVLVRWRGEKSIHLSSRFWKQLQVQLPVRRIKDATLREECSLVPLNTDLSQKSHSWGR